MEQQYFLARRQLELGAALNAQCSEARMIHLDLAARYSVKAAEIARETRIGGPCATDLRAVQLHG